MHPSPIRAKIHYPHRSMSGKGNYIDVLENYIKEDTRKTGVAHPKYLTPLGKGSKHDGRREPVSTLHIQLETHLFSTF